LFEHLGSKEWTPNSRYIAFGFNHVTTGRVVGENNDRLFSRYQPSSCISCTHSSIWAIAHSDHYRLQTQDARLTRLENKVKQQPTRLASAAASAIDPTRVAML
ncbi:hypothetical protein KCU87_g164, partial [Aureobasidium melanogenum]